ncbi:MAG TPA: NAD-binding protein, partial [Bacteroidales bacterium]|nr:NAD-binding protein [Bacteroidales bacterium]
IDRDKERCMSLAESLENTLVINADARDVDVLESEGIREVDAVVAVTDSNETNMFICLLAKRFGVKKVIPLVENIDFIDIAQNLGIEAIINKKLIAASYIARFTMHAEVASIKCLNGVDAEVLEFVAAKNAVVTKYLIKDIPMVKDSIIGGIIRGENSYIAVGNFQIEEGDNVVVFAMPHAIKKIEQLFS